MTQVVKAMNARVVRLGSDGMPHSVEGVDLPLTEPWLDEDTGKSVQVTGAAGSVAITAKDVRIELIAVVTGIPLVDLSMEWDTHIVRGTQ